MADGEVLPPIESKSRVGSVAVSREGSRPASATAPEKLPSINDKRGSNGHAKSPAEEDGHRENGTGDSRGEENPSDGSGEEDGQHSREPDCDLRPLPQSITPRTQHSAALSHS